jgi:hypothetical protein
LPNIYFNKKILKVNKVIIKTTTTTTTRRPATKRSCVSFTFQRDYLLKILFGVYTTESMRGMCRRLMSWLLG